MNKHTEAKLVLLFPGFIRGMAMVCVCASITATVMGRVPYDNWQTLGLCIGAGILWESAEQMSMVISCHAAKNDLPAADEDLEVMEDAADDDDTN